MNTQAIPAGNEAGRSNRDRNIVWRPLLVFILFALATTVAGYSAFQRYRDTIKSDSQHELSGIAALKIGQITTWMTERKGDAQALRDDPLFSAEVERWLRQGGPDGEVKAKLTGRLVSMQQAYAAYGYSAISLFDSQARLRLTSDAGRAPLQGNEKKLVLESMRSGQALFSDLHREKHRSGEVIEIDLAVPLAAGKGKKARRIGAILFHADPGRFLFPLIQQWPTPSASAESLLVRREGGEVVFLNDLRHRKGTALSMRLPVAQPELPGAMAVMGKEGLVEGVDYRGVPVVGVLQRVPGTSWMMVSKVDKAEIYAPVDKLAVWMTVLILALTGAGGSVVFTWWTQQRQRILGMQRQYAGEAEKRLLGEALKQSKGAIVLADRNQCFSYVNPAFTQLFGYALDEVLGKPIHDLIGVAASPSVQPPQAFAITDQSGIFQEETFRRAKDGRIIPVLLSVSAVRDEDGHLVSYIASLTDLTLRKQAEEELAKQKEFIRLVIDSDPNLIFAKDAEGRFLFANEAMAQGYGQTTGSIVGKFNWELVDNPEQVAAFNQANREVVETGQQRVALEETQLADGRKHWLQTIRKPLVQDDGSVSVLTIATDITELKEADERLQRLNRALRLLGACNAAVAHAEAEPQLLMEICKLVVETGGYRMAWVGFAEYDQECSVRPVARYGFDDGYVDSANIRWADAERGRGPVGTAIRIGITQVNQNFRDNPQLLLWREAALARGYQSSIAIPLSCEGRTCGALSIYSAEAQAFNAEEVELLEELANNLAFGIATLRARAERAQAMERLRQSEEHFRFLTERATDMVYLMSIPSGRYEYVSPAATQLFGYTPEEFCNSPVLIRRVIHPDWHPYFEDQWARLLAGEVPPVYEYQIVHKSGETRWMNQRNSAIRSGDGSGTLIAILGVVSDVTERKLAEAQFESQRIRLLTLVQTMPDLVWLKDTDGIYLSCNPQVERLIGAPEAEIVGKTDYDFYDAELADFFRQKDRDAMAAGKPTVNEEWITYPDNGQRTLLETIKMPMRDGTGKLIGVMGIARDITERKQAEERVARLYHILDNTQDMIFIFRPDTLCFVYLNKGAIDSIGYSEEELFQMSPGDINPLMPEPEFRELIAPLVAGEKEKLRFETVHRSKGGRDLPVEVQLQFVKERDERGLFVAIVRDISERKQAEEALHRQKDFMAQVLDTDPNLIFVKNAEGRFIWANHAMAETCGLTVQEMIWKHNAEIYPDQPQDVAAFLALDREVIRERREVVVTESAQSADGRQRWYLTIKRPLVEADGSVNVLGIAVDITEQRLSGMKLAASYKELQRLSAHLENVREEERTRIARELHDEMGATLAAMKMRVAWLGSKLPAAMSQLAEEVGHISELVSDGIQTLRQIVHKLRPSSLEDVGLAMAIEDYVKKFRRNTGIECMLTLPGQEVALEQGQAATLFRILQESLSNVAKHAQASRVDIILAKRRNSLSLVVEDDGIGFERDNKEKSFGLLGIRERALMMGGKARVSSMPGKGTRVSVSIPDSPPPDSARAG